MHALKDDMQLARIVKRSSEKYCSITIGKFLKLIDV